MVSRGRAGWCLRRLSCSALETHARSQGDSVPMGSPRGSPQFLLLLHGSCLKYGSFKMFFCSLGLIINSQSSLHWEMCFTFLVVSLAGSCSCSGDKDSKGHPEDHPPTSSCISSQKLSQGCPTPCAPRRLPEPFRHPRGT